MKKIVCEMCSSNDVIKDGEFYVCQVCGTKYTVESARSLLKDIGTLDIKGKVEIDSSNQVEDYLSMANNAIELNNTKDAFNFIEKILIIEPKNFNALYLKGKISEKIEDKFDCFSYALKCVDSQNESALIENIQKDLLSFYNSKIEYCFSLEKDLGRYNFVQSVHIAVNLIQKEFDSNILKEKIIIDKETILNSFCKRCYEFCLKEGKSALEIIAVWEIKSKKNHVWIHPCKNDSDKLQGIFNILAKIVTATTDIQLKYDIYNTYISFFNQVCNKKYYMTSTVTNLETWDFFIASFLINDYRNKISDYRKELAILQQELDKQKRERIEKYWKAHAEEKKIFDDKKESLLKELNEISPKVEQQFEEIEKVKSGVTKMPANRLIDRFEEEIKSLSVARSKLGIFKGKQKAEIDKRIELLNVELANAKRALVSQREELLVELRKEYLPNKKIVDDLKSKLSEINEELTKDR